MFGSDVDRIADNAVVDKAGAVILEALDGLHDHLLREAGNVEADDKDDGTPVTAVDYEVDDRLARSIHTTFTGHGILSEERDTVAPDTEWTWIIDPIDGTSNFTAGLPWWCISVALAFQGVPVLGVIDAPALGRRYVAARGAGAKRDGRTLAVRRPVDWRSPGYRHLPIMLSPGTARRAHAAGVHLNPRVMGSTALDIAIVGEGIAVASVAGTPHIWDVAAGGVIVEEAGGVLVAPQGDAWLPIRPGVDHQRVSHVTAAAADGNDAADLVARLFTR